MFEKKESKKKLVVGIDIAKEKHYACMDVAGNHLLFLTIELGWKN